MLASENPSNRAWIPRTARHHRNGLLSPAAARDTAQQANPWPDAPGVVIRGARRADAGGREDGRRRSGGGALAVDSGADVRPGMQARALTRSRHQIGAWVGRFGTVRRPAPMREPERPFADEVGCASKAITLSPDWASRLEAC
jgi:hypothetical protein